LSTNFLIRHKGNIFEQYINSSRWQEIKNVSDQFLEGSFAHGENKIRHVRWFMNFMNAIYYKLDIPNFNVCIINVFKLLFYSIYYSLFEKASHTQRIKNIIRPDLDITKA
jgi:hypothetical protein